MSRRSKRAKELILRGSPSAIAGRRLQNNPQLAMRAKQIRRYFVDTQLATRTKLLVLMIVPPLLPGCRQPGVFNLAGRMAVLQRPNSRLHAPMRWTTI
jgi:hypothetical protein